MDVAMLSRAILQDEPEILNISKHAELHLRQHHPGELEPGAVARPHRGRAENRPDQ